MSLYIYISLSLFLSLSLSLSSLCLFSLCLSIYLSLSLLSASFSLFSLSLFSMSLYLSLSLSISLSSLSLSFFLSLSRLLVVYFAILPPNCEVNLTYIKSNHTQPIAAKHTPATEDAGRDEINDRVLHADDGPHLDEPFPLGKFTTIFIPFSSTCRRIIAGDIARRSISTGDRRR